MDCIVATLNSLRNAQMAGHQKVTVPFSKIVFSILKIMEREGFVSSVSLLSDSGSKRSIVVGLLYEQISPSQRKPLIRGLRRVSRLGQRVYVKKGDIFPVKNGYGFSIISTSCGVMTNREARRRGIGGEVLCEVW